MKWNDGEKSSKQCIPALGLSNSWSDRDYLLSWKSL